eukprot:1108423-Pleurochrysis_carterae.AAC.3
MAAVRGVVLELVATLLADGDGGVRISAVVVKLRFVLILVAVLVVIHIWLMVGRGLGDGIVTVIDCGCEFGGA